MSEKQEDRERRLIREKIVPRHHTKNIIVMILSAAGLGILFGLTAAVSYYLTKNTLVRNDETQAAQIVIVRDETGEETEDETETESTEAEGTEDTEVPESAPEPISENLSRWYDSISSSIVTVKTVSREDSGWTGTENSTVRDTFGCIIAVTDQYIYVLTDGAGIQETDTTVVGIENSLYTAELQQRDDRTHICILKVQRNLVTAYVQALELGNSFLLDLSDPVMMVGAPLNVPGAVVGGSVTNIVDYDPVTDGYRQLIYTDMAAEAGGSAILIDEEGCLIGWISDYTADVSESTAVAAGISPLKYILEDELSGLNSAFLGITCIEISAEDAAVTGKEAGLYVSSVAENSPAFESGIQTGDRLDALNGHKLTTNYMFLVRLDETEAGDTIELTLERQTGSGTRPVVMDVSLGSR